MGLDSNVIRIWSCQKNNQINKPADSEQTHGKDIQHAHPGFVLIKLMYADEAEKKTKEKSHPFAPLPTRLHDILNNDGGLLHIALRGIGDIWLLGIYHLLRRIGLLRILLLRLRGIVLIQGSLHFLRSGFRTDRIAAFGTEFFIGLRTAFFAKHTVRSLLDS